MCGFFSSSKVSSVGSLGSALSSYDSDDDDDSTSDEMLDSGSSDTEDDLDSERGRGKISDAVSEIRYSRMNQLLKHQSLFYND